MVLENLSKYDVAIDFSKSVVQNKINMSLTKSDLREALKLQREDLFAEMKKQKKEIIVEIGKFLEDYVLKPIFGLKKDVGVLKKGMREVKHELEQVHRRVDASLDYSDRHSEQLKDHEKRIMQLEHASL